MRPIVLTILDGWGYSRERNGNAIASAKTPTLDEISQNYPSLLLQASGPAVGMTYGEPGNSEVGHLTIGTGRVIFQYLARIAKAIQKGDFSKNPVLGELAEHVQKNKSTLHIIGLLTSGAVHAHIDHVIALVAFAKNNNLPYKIHLFTDGRDSGLKEAPELLKKLSREIGGLEALASVIGRDIAMDRNNNWSFTQTAFDLITHGVGTKTTDIYNSLSQYYAQDIHDADIPPTVIQETKIADNDALVFFNFREDSMRQLIKSFTESDFKSFNRILPNNLYLATMTRYTESSQLHVLFPPPTIQNSLSEVLSTTGKKHFHIAETEKYAHVTFFFNGLRDTPFEHETDFFLESLSNPSEHPEMRAVDIATRTVEELQNESYDLYVINIANADILAHLGNLEHATQGIEAIDQAIAIIKEKVLEKDGYLIITADHGNAESMIYKKTGEQETMHDSNPVPFYLIAQEYKRTQSPEEVSSSLGEPKGLLADIAPTILELMKNRSAGRDDRHEPAFSLPSVDAAEKAFWASTGRYRRELYESRLKTRGGNS
jgi:2,3-bisphosphoglycerate-independent phosphoglycerate mutase